MKKTAMLLAALTVLTFATSSFAATKTYQVTGPVLAMTADSITIQKGSEKWEIARGAATIPATVKVGSKVTVQYSMTAASVTDKGTANAQ